MINDVFIETVRAIVVLVIVVSIWKSSGQKGVREAKGWKMISIGFHLILFAVVLDITDNFENLNRFIVIGDTVVQSFLEKMIGYLLGFIFLAIGFAQWLPEIARYDETETELKELKDSLDLKVQVQTDDLVQKQLEMNGQKNAMMNVLEDIGEEKQRAEHLAKDLEKFKLALENVSEHVVITDGEGVVLYANRAAEEMTGYSAKESIGKKSGELWGHLMNKDFYETMWNTIKKKKKTFVGEMQNKRKNGQLYDVAVNISPVLNDQKEVVFFVGIERDITLEKQINKAKTEFISIASHQLKTPVASNRWALETVLEGKQGKVSKKVHDLLKQVYDNDVRMLRLVDDLLYASRIDEGQTFSEPIPVSLAKVIDELVVEVGVLASPHGIRVVSDFDKDSTLRVFADPGHIRQIIRNLLTNAVKFSRQDGEVNVGVKTIKNKVVISVSDSGVGIPLEDQKSVFTKFYRANNARKSDTTGSGLGLYIAKSYTQQAKGRIWFESKEGEGTTFYVELPAKK
jgi:PAS domain S-box-containing protein